IVLLPGQAVDLRSAAEELLGSLAPEFLAEFDVQVETEVLQPKGGIWSFVRGLGDRAREIRQELLSRSESALSKALGDMDAARLFVEAHRDAAQARQALANLLQKAKPLLESERAWQHLIAAIPSSRSGATLRDLLLDVIGNTSINVVDSETD